MWLFNLLYFWFWSVFISLSSLYTVCKSNRLCGSALAKICASLRALNRKLQLSVKEQSVLWSSFFFGAVIFLICYLTLITLCYLILIFFLFSSVCSMNTAIRAFQTTSVCLRPKQNPTAFAFVIENQIHLLCSSPKRTLQCAENSSVFSELVVMWKHWSKTLYTFALQGVKNEDCMFVLSDKLVWDYSLSCFISTRF